MSSDHGTHWTSHTVSHIQSELLKQASPHTPPPPPSPLEILRLILSLCFLKSDVKELVL